MSNVDNKIGKSIGDIIAPIGFGVLAEFIILVVGITLTVIYYHKMNKNTRIVAITLLSLSPFIVFGVIMLSIKILGINFHDGPLPKYAGLYSSSWAIINKEKKHGVCWHKIEKGVDTGNIIGERKFSINSFNTAYDIDVKGVLLGIKLFNKIIKQLNNDKIKFKKQNLSLRSYYGAKHLKKFYKKYKSFDKNSNIIRAFKLSTEKEKQLIKILKIKTLNTNFTKDNQNNFEKHYNSKQYKKKLFKVFGIVKKVFKNKVNLPLNKRKKFSYIENLGLGNHSVWDSLEHIKFLINVEKEFKIKINETNGSNFNNVGSIARYLIKTQPF